MNYLAFKVKVAVLHHRENMDRKLKVTEISSYYKCYPQVCKFSLTVDIMSQQ